ncbi:3-dehydroquinate synthase [Limihaloglobus sulfuriphilus]|uniref:3-dehydroquinate synthase n=1 Tax=Limihaloglobus sulfuriphilus TaxID=1851148 RepID=A0A1Q2ME06_9BACT|nr:3-dehydroquinate synthase [Limihaloglobus sulfuriphilus]AQQ70768.1 3-dehydroquinate synthase [Limihaloglobus sulfuriphilus]
MKELTVHAQSGGSRVLVGDFGGDFSRFVPEDKPAVIITDSNVAGIYAERFPDCPVITTVPGEENKTLGGLEKIYSGLLECGADRSWFILAVGGGIVCDTAGFAASTYMRGIDFGFISTTLLANIDASVGGKNGVNFHGYKNIVGVFSQPRFVVCDVSTLATLRESDYRCGLAEMIKHGAIRDARHFENIEDNMRGLLKRDISTVETLVYESVSIKAEVVAQDERESGLRKTLNFGHTFAHAIEKVCKLAHGQAVSVGMCIASRLSVEMGLLCEDKHQRLKGLIETAGLPVSLHEKASVLADAIAGDKKRHGGEIDFILLEDLGKAVIKPIPIARLQEIIRGFEF